MQYKELIEALNLTKRISSVNWLNRLNHQYILFQWGNVVKVGIDATS